MINRRRKFRRLNRKLNNFLSTIVQLGEMGISVDSQEVNEIYAQLREDEKMLYKQLGHMHECFEKPITEIVLSSPTLGLILQTNELEQHYRCIDAESRSSLETAFKTWAHFRNYWEDRKLAMRAFG